MPKPFEKPDRKLREKKPREPKPDGAARAINGIRSRKEILGENSSQAQSPSAKRFEKKTNPLDPLLLDFFDAVHVLDTNKANEAALDPPRRPHLSKEIGGNQPFQHLFGDSPRKELLNASEERLRDIAFDPSIRKSLNASKERTDSSVSREERMLSAWVEKMSKDRLREIVFNSLRKELSNAPVEEIMSGKMAKDKLREMALNSPIRWLLDTSDLRKNRMLSAFVGNMSIDRLREMALHLLIKESSNILRRCYDQQQRAKNYLEGLKSQSTAHTLGDRFDISEEVRNNVTAIKDTHYQPKAKELRGFPEKIQRTFEEVNSNEATLKVKRAAIFYLQMIRPFVQTGKGSFVPDQNYKGDLCQQLASPEGANIVLSYSLFKVQSSSRANAPDSVIAMAEVEMLRQYCVMARVAKDLGLTLHVTLTNEADVFPSDDPMGLNDKDKAMNMMIANGAIKEFGADGLVTIRPLKASVASALGADFDHLYQTQKASCRQEIRRQIAENRGDLKSSAFALLDSLPDKHLAQLGITSPEAIQSIRAMKHQDRLDTLPPALVGYLVKITATWRAFLNLREAAQTRVRQEGKTNEYPEYAPNRVHAGLTRSSTRLSLRTSREPFGNQPVFPSFGIAVYRKTDTQVTYAGVAKYPDLTHQKEAGEAIEIVSLENKPIFAVWKEASYPTGWPSLYRTEKFDHDLVFIHLQKNPTELNECIDELRDVSYRKMAMIANKRIEKTLKRMNKLKMEARMLIEAVSITKRLLLTLVQAPTAAPAEWERIMTKAMEEDSEVKPTQCPERLVKNCIVRVLSNYVYESLYDNIYNDEINNKGTDNSILSISKAYLKKLTQMKDKSIEEIEEIEEKKTLSKSDAKVEKTLYSELDALDDATEVIDDLKDWINDTKSLGLEKWQEIIENSKEEKDVDIHRLVRTTIVMSCLNPMQVRNEVRDDREITSHFDEVGVS